MALGIKSGYFCKSSKNEKLQNYFNDSTNDWKDNADDSDKLTLAVSVSVVFLAGFLVSQILFVFGRDNKTEVIQNSDFSNSDIFLDSFIDYALGVNGGRILEEYSQEEYMGWFSVLSNNKRESLLSQNNEPGNCWAFDGAHGYIGIQLADKILPRNFTIYHINTLKYATAPKILNVYSLSGGEECVLLARFEFKLQIQGVKRKNWGMFECQYHCNEYVDKVLLEVVENYGADGTCVYQFRVHGVTQL